MATMRDLIRQAEKQIGRLRSNLEKASTGADAASVHDVRVCCRRLNEPLEFLCREYKDKAAGKARKELRKLRQAFQKVRDLDVLQSMLSSGEGSPLQPPELARLEGLIAGRRERAIQKAQAHIQRPKSLKALRQIERLLDDYRKSADSSESLDEPLEQYLFTRRSELIQNAPSGECEDLHQTRIHLKRFRYATELVQRTEGKEDRALMDQITHMQDLLGQWNDWTIAAEKMIKLARRRGNLVETAWSSRLLELGAAFLRQAHAQRDRVLADWPALAGAIESLPQPAGMDLAGATT